MTYNPLNVFPNRNYGWESYSTLKSHLMLPRAYLKVIFRNYPVTLSSVPIDLPVLLNRYHEHLWRNMKIDSAKRDIYLKLAGVPPSYISDTRIPDSSSDVLKAWSTISRGIDRFCGKGRILYLHSLFQENAMIAATEIVKSAIDKKVSSYCISVPSYLEEIKLFERTDKLKKCEESELLLLYFLGTEYQTPFTDVQIDTLIQRRIVEKKTTIIVASLDEKSYNKRYSKDILGTVLKFTDKKLRESLDDILKELED